MPPQIPCSVAEVREIRKVRPCAEQWGGSRHRLRKPRRLRLLAVKDRWLFLCRDISRGCPEKKETKGGRGPRMNDENLS